MSDRFNDKYDPMYTVKDRIWTCGESSGLWTDIEVSGCAGIQIKVSDGEREKSPEKGGSYYRDIDVEVEADFGFHSLDDARQMANMILSVCDSIDADKAEHLRRVEQDEKDRLLHTVLRERSERRKNS